MEKSKKEIIKKVVNVIGQAILFFIVILFIIWVSQKMGFLKETEYIPQAICMTIGWMIAQGISNVYHYTKTKIKNK